MQTEGKFINLAEIVEKFINFVEIGEICHDLKTPDRINKQ